MVRVSSVTHPTRHIQAISETESSQQQHCPGGKSFGPEAAGGQLEDKNHSLETKSVRTLKTFAPMIIDQSTVNKLTCLFELFVLIA